MWVAFLLFVSIVDFWSMAAARIDLEPEVAEKLKTACAFLLR